MENCFQKDLLEAGCDEAGRGCLAGPVFAAAVILPPDYKPVDLRDSKKLSIKKRQELRQSIEKEAICFAVEEVSVEEIDRINILNASLMGMQRAVLKLSTPAEFLAIDGNRFHAMPGIPHNCIVKGDDLYLNIAAASVLAKTYRDEYMENLHGEFPQYNWRKNKGYGTKMHVEAIRKFGFTAHHRKSFHVKSLVELRLDL